MHWQFCQGGEVRAHLVPFVFFVFFVFFVVNSLFQQVFYRTELRRAKRELRPTYSPLV